MNSQPCAMTPHEGHRQAGSVFVRERLLHAEAEHRLANLLQLVSSNLFRAARQAGEPRARAAIDEAAEQVTAIGHLHQSLAPVSGSLHVAAAIKLRELCGSLETLLLRPGGHVLTLRVHAGAADLQIPADLARHLALIVTELLINAAKHAFPAGTAGHVAVELIRQEGGIACIVRDDGVGVLPDHERIFSQGMKLAHTLAAQAGGRCRWLLTRAGTEVNVLLPLAGKSHGSQAK